MSSSLGLYVCSRIKSHEEARLPESTISAVAAEQAEAEKDFKHLVDDKVRISLFSQYFTSPALAVKMVEKLGLLEGKDIADIAVGSGNLIAAAVIAGADPKRCYGIELDEKMLALCRKRLRKLGVPERNLVCGSAFDESSY